MRSMKKGLTLLAAVVLVLGMGSMAYAFHSGGVAECEGCHSMHDGMSPANLLVGSDNSSTCLSCHEHAGDTGPSSYHISTAEVDMPAGTPPLQRTPGGDFGWLKKSYSFLVRGTATDEDGNTHGHNIIAADNSYVVDPHNATAPGGTFNSNYLTCDACHDKHGQYRRIDDAGTIVRPAIGVAVPPIVGSGSYHNSANPTATGAVGVYRLLAGPGYVKDGVTFAANPPMVVVNSSYNSSEATKQVRTAYGKGMADWCATCHPDMHTDSGRLVHPVERAMGGTIFGLYNAYKKSGDLTGTQATSFLSLVPYEEDGTATYSTLKTIAAQTANVQPGPSNSNAQVMCLSCHRAHASGWPEMLRWQYQYEFMTVEGVWGGTDSAVTAARDGRIARGRTEAETAAAYYDRPASMFATYQRMLCNKCHAKD